MHVPQLVVATVIYAIIFPLLMRLATRKWIGWKATLIAALTYAVIVALLTYTNVVHSLAHMLRL